VRRGQWGAGIKQLIDRDELSGLHHSTRCRAGRRGYVSETLDQSIHSLGAVLDSSSLLVGERNLRQHPVQIATGSRSCALVEVSDAQARVQKCSHNRIRHRSARRRILLEDLSGNPIELFQPVQA
jgi:hypothetical protein